MKRKQLNNLVIVDGTYSKEELEAIRQVTDMSDPGSVSLEITAQTTLEDIKEAWPEIKKLQEKIVGYKKRVREKAYPERDERIIELWKQKKNPPDIVPILESEGFGEISRNQVSNIISRYTKKYGRRRGDLIETIVV
jgi:hypothetical protein